MMRAFLIFFLLSAGATLAQQTCPLGLTNDSLPGKCGLFTDANNDSICDHSQAAAQEQEPISEGTSTDGTAPEDPAPEPETGSAGYDDNPATDPARDGGAETTAASLGNEPEPEPAPDPAPRRINYHFWEILIFTWILGLATEFWIKAKPERTMVLQAAWNWLLLLSFLGSALSGLYFVLPFERRPALGFNFSYWHTVVSIAFIAIGLYHTIRRFACLLGKPGPCLKNGACKEAKKRSK
ncbi:MAG: DUF4405 domain-containing protein [bacterium]|nr:DUF4405 domain-containing protein [bacterium]